MKEKGWEEKENEAGGGEKKKRQQAEPRINKHLFVRFFENKFLL